MAKVLQEGCIVVCGYCGTKFSFEPHEAHASFKNVPAGYSPEEEAYERVSFQTPCPKCHQPVDAETALGPAGKRAAEARARSARAIGNHDL